MLGAVDFGSFAEYGSAAMLDEEVDRMPEGWVGADTTKSITPTTLEGKRELAQWDWLAGVLIGEVEHGFECFDSKINRCGNATFVLDGEISR